MFLTLHSINFTAISLEITGESSINFTKIIKMSKLVEVLEVASNDTPRSFDISRRFLSTTITSFPSDTLLESLPRLFCVLFLAHLNPNSRNFNTPDYARTQNEQKSLLFCSGLSTSLPQKSMFSEPQTLDGCYERRYVDSRSRRRVEREALIWLF